jgi:hypothetical protein
MLELHEPPDGLIQPVIDGMISSPNEWQNAGRCGVREGKGPLPAGSLVIQDLLYGSDDRNIYLRIDWREQVAAISPLDLHLKLRNRTGRRFHTEISVGANGASVWDSNLPESAVAVASKALFEMRISMEALQLRRGDSLFLHLEIYREGVPHFVLPPGSELELPWSMMAAYAV